MRESAGVRGDYDESAPPQSAAVREVGPRYNYD